MMSAGSQPIENSTLTNQVSSDQYLIRSNEAELVIAAQKGSVEAFNQLVQSYQDRIYSLCVRILGDYDLADDIAQNTFVTAYLNLPRFRNGSFRSWLYRIATNACYDEFRRHKRYPVLSLEDQEASEENLSPLYDFSARTLLPEIETERAGLKLTVQQALNQLDVQHRAVVLLVDQQDLDYQQAADVLGIPIGTLKSRLARARQRLHDLLNQAGIAG